MTSQLLLNALITASTYILLAVGFGLIFSIVNFFHFTHGIIFVLGAYFTFLFHIQMECPISTAILFAIVLSGFLGGLIEICIYQNLRHKRGSSLILLLSSMGIYVILQNVISLVFGEGTKTIRSEFAQESLSVFDARIMPIQIIGICTSALLVVFLTIFLKKTKLGITIRSVANDQELAKISGIPSDKIIVFVFVIGSALAALAGILLALDIDMNPTMGMNALMMGVIVVIIGGINSIPGIALAALLLATAQHFGAWFIGSQWQDVIAYIILVLFLLFKPEGFFGKKVKNTIL